MSEKYRGHQLENENKPLIPTFYVCSGVSGAGATTAVKHVETLGLAEFGPSHFTTRPARPGEKRGDQYYFVTPQILEQIPQQIVLQKFLSENDYGVFIPAVNAVKRKLNFGNNVILDSIHSPLEWSYVLGPKFNVVSVFFAPGNPQIATERIIERAMRSNDPLLDTYLSVRIREDSKHIKQVVDYDYWIDTIDHQVTQSALTTAILNSSFGLDQSDSGLHLVSESKKVEKLIEDYVSRGTN